MMVQQDPSFSIALLGSLMPDGAWKVGGGGGGGKSLEGMFVKEQEKEGGGGGASHLVAYDAVVGQTQVGQRVVSELEGALVQLRHRLVHVQDGELLVDLTDHLEPDETRERFHIF